MRSHWIIAVRDWRPSLVMSLSAQGLQGVHTTGKTAATLDALCADNRAYAFAMIADYIHDAQHLICCVNRVFVSMKPLSQTKMLQTTTNNIRNGSVAD